MRKRTCKNCKAWHDYSCRRRAPQLIADDLSDDAKAVKPWATPQCSSLWPTVQNDDWCLDFVEGRSWWTRLHEWLQT